MKYEKQTTTTPPSITISDNPTSNHSYIWSDLHWLVADVRRKIYSISWMSHHSTYPRMTGEYHRSICNLSIIFDLMIFKANFMCSTYDVLRVLAWRSIVSERCSPIKFWCADIYSGTLLFIRCCFISPPRTVSFASTILCQQFNFRVRTRVVVLCALVLPRRTDVWIMK